jgi:hypothetical protein
VEGLDAASIGSSRGLSAVGGLGVAVACPLWAQVVRVGGSALLLLWLALSILSASISSL